MVGSRDPTKTKTFHETFESTPPMLPGGADGRGATTRYKALFSMRESPDGLFFGEPISIEFIVKPKMDML